MKFQGHFKASLIKFYSIVCIGDVFYLFPALEPYVYSDGPLPILDLKYN